MRLGTSRGRPLALASAVATIVALGVAPAVAQASSAGEDRACAAAQLSLDVPASIAGDPMAGMDKLAWNILLRNTGTTCALTGWPALQVRDPAGKPAAIRTADVRFGNLGPVPVRRVVLRHGQQAVVTVDTTDTARGCAAGWTLRLTLPGAGGTVTAAQPADLSAPCGGGELDLSPFYPRSALTAAIKALSVSASPPVYRPARTRKPAACTPALLRVSARAMPAGSGASAEVLRLTSRGATPCVLPTQWPTVTLRESTRASQVAKALSVPLPGGAKHDTLTAYGRADDITVRPGASTAVVLVTLTTGSGCYRAASATLYPAAYTTGTGTRVTLPGPLAFCGLPRVLPFLAGQPTASALRTVARELAHPGIQPDGDRPKGYWYGSDSNSPVPTRSSGGVWLMPDSPRGGAYGGYIGEIGSYQNWQGCVQGGLNWNQTGYNDAQSNALNHNDGVGAGVYWMMAGAGREPSYSSTSKSKATNWGTDQAERVLADFQESIWFPYVFMDIENADGFGWNAAWASPCSGTEVAGSVPAAIDRDTFNGFWNEIADHSAYYPSVYNAGGGGPNAWDSIFGSGEHLSDTSEWTYENETTSLASFPTGFSVGGTTPLWYASAPSKCELLWQWSGGGGALNGIGDFDQIDANRNKACE